MERDCSSCGDRYLNKIIKPHTHTNQAQFKKERRENDISDKYCMLLEENARVGRINNRLVYKNITPSHVTHRSKLNSDRTGLYLAPRPTCTACSDQSFERTISLP
mmetsp:Transcript_45392/g.73024  ORF Transcript_45392/g.73024 Transcript_45392/m.73024 type:complete len:105 (+) Transcript_45392:247-561(+)